MPRKMRLQPIDARHPEIAALVCDPLVLFAIRGDNAAALTRSQLLAARQSANQNWEAGDLASPVKFLPYVEIGD